MYFYVLNMRCEDINYCANDEWFNSYLQHNKEFTEEEFHNMCDIAKAHVKETYDEITLYTIEDFLVDTYDFKKVVAVRSYEFDEEVNQ